MLHLILLYSLITFNTGVTIEGADPKDPANPPVIVVKKDPPPKKDAPKKETKK
jgi:hypothetical protein